MMMTKTQMQKLRFPEFSEDWKQVVWESLYRFVPTNSLSRENLNYESGSIKNIHYGDIHTSFRARFVASKEIVPYVNSSINIDKLHECEEGDVIIADASEDYNDIGKSIEIIDLTGQRIVAGLHTLHAKPKTKSIAVGYAAYMMSSSTLRKGIQLNAQGTKVLGISAGRINSLEFKIPSLSEQKKISSFLASVDTKIDQLERKKAFLEEYKKGCIQQLFSQKIRFKANSGKDFPDWEEKRLGEIATFSKGKGISKADIAENGKNLCIRYGELYTEYSEYVSEIVSRTDTPIKSSVLSKKNDILMPTSDVTPNGLATVSALDIEGIILGGDILIIRSKQLLNLFFAYFVAANKPMIMRLVTGATVYHIYGSDLATLHFKIPHMDEQIKIADFLFSIDKKKELVTSELEKAKHFKQGLLQQMFV